MIDLPMLLHKKTQQIAEERMAMLNIVLAPNMKEEAFKSLVDGFMQPFDDGKPDEFDAEGLDALRRRIGKRVK